MHSISSLLLARVSVLRRMSCQASETLRAQPKLRGVVFDMDGTLTVPNLDFKTMYAKCGVPLTEDLLAAVASMPDEKKTFANGVIEAMEEEGRRTLQLSAGVVEMAKWLDSHDIPCAMVTRNTQATVDSFFSQLWKPAGLKQFSIALSRDSSLNLPAKPDPASLFFIAEQWGVSLPSEELLMVGDSPSNDVGFGKAAGIATALVDSGRRHLEEGEIRHEGGGGADICVQSLAFLPRYLYSRWNIGGPLGTGTPLLKYDLPSPSTSACIAAVNGDMGFFSSLSTQDLNQSDGSGNTPLIWAADAGHLDIIQKLISMGVDLDRPGYLGNTACSRASRKGHIEVLRALCAAGANADIANVKMQYPLHFAAFKKHPEAVDVLLDHGANALVLDRKGRTPSEDTSDALIRCVLTAAMLKQLRRTE